MAAFKKKLQILNIFLKRDVGPYIVSTYFRKP